MNKFALIILSLILASCSGTFNLNESRNGVWKYSDLKMIDPSDMVDSNQDIVAIFLRERGTEIQIRIDFMDQQPGGQPNLMIYFDHGSGSARLLPFDMTSQIEWNQLLVIPPDGHIGLLDQQLGHVSRANVIISRDPNLNAIIISLDKKSLDGWSLKTRITVFSLGLNINKAVYDEAGPINISCSPPSLGEVRIGFWNTFHAETPAQALRAWDGAHTGPNSSRHGLKSLVDAIEATGIPVFISDLMMPDNISALDYLGAKQRIKRLEDQGMLIPLPQDYLFQQNYESDAGDNSDPLSKEDPSISLRKMLVENALNPKQTIWLGGDFAKSTWGNYSTALSILAYIKNHPWIKVTRNLPAKEVLIIQAPEESNPLIEEIEIKLKRSPSNEIRFVAERFLSLLTKPGNLEEEALRQKYLGQIGHLIAIATWSKDRQAVSDCTKDLDWDGQPECILASLKTALVLDLQGGYISFAFTFSEGKFHQIIGPSYQLATGLSDPTTWNLENGIASDPSIIPGAFAGNNWDQQSFSFDINSPNSITLRDDQLMVQKTFQISEEGIQFSYKGPQPEQLSFPLIIDPWIMDTPDWGDQYKNSVRPGIWEWEIYNHIKVSVHTNDSMEVRTFKDSSDMIRFPEDPNYAYPAGHFLPFPLALGIIKTGTEGIVYINMSP